MEQKESTRQGRVSYSAQDRRELLAEFESSGLTQAAFCREWNIHPTTFGKWLRSEQQEDSDVSFCEVRTAVRSYPAGEVRVCLPNGIEVAVPIGSAEELACVLREAAACSD